MKWCWQWLSKAHQTWFERVHPVRLDLFRRLFALTFLAYMAFQFLSADEWLTPYGFHYTAETERYSNPDPFPLMPPAVVPLFGVVLFGSILSVIVGWKVRLMSWLVFACAVYVQLVDLISAYTLNKLYVAIFAVLAFASPPRVFPASDGNSRLRQSSWPIRLIQATLIIQYFTAGTCKVLHGSWLKSRSVLWTQIQGTFRTDFAAFLLRMLPKWAWSVQMYSGLAFELLAPLLLIIRRLRPVGMIWGLSFQIIIAVTMEKLFFFSFQMVSFYLLFLDEKTLLSLQRWCTEFISRYRSSE
ncbi:MAG: HTTM domain-containing protein [Candidatus Poribacteria bacterium]|nr:HTTM domain-containing protein [Candidatus Poribacteria bacterium]